MKLLSYDTIRAQHCAGYLLREAPERVLQLGEGNFLRAFVDYFIDVANEKAGFNAKVVVVQPIAQGLAGMLNEQEGLYTLYLRGVEGGKKAEEKRVISCISRAINPYEDYDALLACAYNPDLRYIVSNTTEAGIVYDDGCKPDDRPPASFPAKLTRFLYERYRAFEGKSGAGLVILACELIDNNGKVLEECVMRHIGAWGLEQAFREWVKREVQFCSTLVDRIVTGYPREEAEALNAENGYEDALLDTGEIFGLWVIEGPESLEEELPFQKAGLPVKVVRDHAPYKQQKVRILNGAHTSLMPVAYLSGRNIVRDCMEDSVLRAFLGHVIRREIIPTLPLPREESEAFAASVLDRFKNPYIDHSLLSIALNSTSKWRARVLPTLKGYVETYGTIPPCIAFCFAAHLAFYRGVRLEEQGMIGSRGGQDYTVSDDRHALEFYFSHRGDSNADLAAAAAEAEDLWGENLSRIPGFVRAVTQSLDWMDEKGVYNAVESLLRQEGAL